MKTIRGLVVATLLAIWCFPAVSSAKSLSAVDPAPLPGLVTSTSGKTEAGTTAAAATTSSEASDLATREQQSRNLQDFKGGYAVIYVGSGVVLVLVIVLLILLI